MWTISIDFETRSTIDLDNVTQYARHPSTDVICLCVGADGADAVHTWVPEWVRERIGHLAPAVDHWLTDAELVQMLAGDTIITAHNAEFEMTIWEHIMVPRYGFPPISLDRWRCSMARAARHGLPVSLESACAAVGAAVQKDSAGRRLMLKMCKPRGPRRSERDAHPDWADRVYWWDEPLDLVRLVCYCQQDVRAEQALSAVTQPLPAPDLEMWRMTQKINRRGVGVDAELVARLGELVDRGRGLSTEQLSALTHGYITSGRQYDRLRGWLETQGVFTDSVAADQVTELLAGEALNPRARQVLQIVQELSRSSLAKLTRAARSLTEGRLRNLYCWHRASTGRWASWGVQVHNLPRGAVKDAPAAADEFLATGGWKHHNLDTQTFCSSLIRACFVAGPGKDLLAGDFSSIEGRLLAWLADEEAVLELYRTGEDPYKYAAAAIYGVSPRDIKDKSPERQIGKVAELALGYQGWAPAFEAMGRGYGVRVSLDEAADIAKKWRQNRRRTVQAWHDAEAALLNAIRMPRQVFTAVKSRFYFDGVWLTLQLPSGRSLFYYRPYEDEIDHYGRCKIAPFRFGERAGAWGPQKLNGGTIVENIVQGLGYDLQAAAMLRVESRLETPIVLHTHDEVIAEIDQSCGADVVERFVADMTQVPDWARGCPIEVKTWRGRRNRKD